MFQLHRGSTVLAVISKVALVSVIAVSNLWVWTSIHAHIDSHNEDFALANQPPYFGVEEEVSAKTKSLIAIQTIEIIKVGLMESYGLEWKKADDFARWIHSAHLQTGVPVGHLASLIATESSFRYQATSSAGAVGPAQVTPRFWQKKCNLDLLDPESNVLCGAKALLHYKARCPDWECAFATYNVGPKHYQDPDYKEAAERYSAKIKRHQELFDSLYSVFGHEMTNRPLVTSVQ